MAESAKERANRQQRDELVVDVSRRGAIQAHQDAIASQKAVDAKVQSNRKANTAKQARKSKAAEKDKK